MNDIGRAMKKDIEAWRWLEGDLERRRDAREQVVRRLLETQPIECPWMPRWIGAGEESKP